MPRLRGRDVLAHLMVVVPQDLGCKAGQGLGRVFMLGRDQVVHLDPETERYYLILRSGYSLG